MRSLASLKGGGAALTSLLRRASWVLRGATRYNGQDAEIYSMKHKRYERHTVGPPSGPDSTTPGHVVRVHEDETSVENVGRVQSNGLSTAGDSLGLVDGHDGVAGAVDRDEALVPL